MDITTIDIAERRRDRAMGRDPAVLNRTVGLTSLAAGAVTGMVMGLRSFGRPAPEAIGDYGDLPRRLLRRDGRLLANRYWDRCTLFDVIHRPKNISVAELEGGIRWLFQELYNEREFVLRKRHYANILRKTGISRRSRRVFESDGNKNDSNFHGIVRHNRREGESVMTKKRDEGLLLGLIARLTGRDVRALRPGDCLRRVLGLDGLDLVRVLIAAEELYGVIVRDDQIDGIRTYGDLLQSLEIAEANCEPGRPA